MTFNQFIEQYQKVPVAEHPNTVLVSMPTPLVSVKVSTYQHAPFIRECLDGILMQKTSFPFEILIGEDESSDGTREICQEYTDRYPHLIRLFLHSRKNNIAIDGRPSSRFQSTYTRYMCRGKYVAICEGDDYWTDPKKLQKQVTFLEENSEYVLTCGGFKHLENGISTDVIARNPTDPRNQAENGFTFELNDRREEWLTKTLTVVYRAHADLPSVLSRYRYTRDAHLYYHLLKGGSGFYFQEVLGVYNVHSGGVHSSTDKRTRIKTYYLVYRELFRCNRDSFTRYKAFKATVTALRRNVPVKEGNLTAIQTLLLTFEALRLARSIDDLLLVYRAFRRRYRWAALQ